MCLLPGGSVSNSHAALYSKETESRQATPVHSKCHRSILFFRKLYLFFFYKSTTGTKVKVTDNSTQDKSYL